MVEAFPKAKIEPLEIGDLATDDMHTIIERKNMDDLLASIMDGRYKDQVRTLINLPSFVIVVGELSPYNKGKEKYVHGAMSSLMMKYRIPTYHVKDNKAFIRKVESILKKRSKMDDLSVVVKRHSNDPQLNLFCSIPNIGGKKAKQLYEEFGSIYKLCNATVDDIVTLDGFGQKTAETIINSLRNGCISAPTPTLND